MPRVQRDTVGEEPRQTTGGDFRWERRGAWPGVPDHAGRQGVQRELGRERESGSTEWRRTTSTDGPTSCLMEDVESHFYVHHCDRVRSVFSQAVQQKNLLHITQARSSSDKIPFFPLFHRSVATHRTPGIPRPPLLQPWAIFLLWVFMLAPLCNQQRLVVVMMWLVTMVMGGEELEK